ncbi:hypothetical protein MHYP_G00180210 [Metynnis hypsauchen]
MKNVLLRAGDQLKVQGKIHADAKRFQIDLGASSSELALHFNPRFQDDNADTPLCLVCNSRSGDLWDQEQRDTPNPFQPGSSFKVVVKHTGKLFEVKLPDEQAIEFPNRQGVETVLSTSTTPPCEPEEYVKAYLRKYKDASFRSKNIGPPRCQPP